MAADEALARSVEPGRAVLRLYSWETPTVSFGRNEPARRLYDRDADVAFVRRPTGGRAVLHDRELTYAVALPLPRRGLRELHRRIHGAVAEGLRILGLDVALAPDPARAPGPGAGPCFAAPAGGEVTLGGRKLVGSAQARVEGALLQHGSVLLAGGQGRLEALRREGAAGAPPPDAGGPTRGAAPAAPGGAATVADALGREPEPAEVAEALAAGFRAHLGGTWEEAAWDPGALGLARRLVGRYRSEDWTWRR